MLIQILHVVAAALATFRITELFLLDRITQKLRDKWPNYLWTCPRCLSVWAGIITTACFFWHPWLNWPLALAYLYIAHNDRIYASRTSKEGRQLILKITPDGTGSVLRNELSPKELSGFVSHMLKSPDTPSQA